MLRFEVILGCGSGSSDLGFRILGHVVRLVLLRA